MKETELLELTGRDAEIDALVAEGRRRKLTVITARVGVWGIIGGLGSVIVGSAFPGVGIIGASLGFMAGGLGVVGTALLVLKDLKRASLPLKLAAVVGLPFGISLSLFSLQFFLGVSGPSWLMSLALPGAPILGVILVVLLVVGLVSNAIRGDGSPPEA